jgi:exodeoxyribonuclease VII small subunit
LGCKVKIDQLQDEAKYLTGRRSQAKAKAMSTEAREPSFEEALKALEEIVRKLESGEAPLDESIALYEQGHKLRALCQSRLDAAQARIEQIVMGADGTPSTTRPFDAG